MTKTFQERQKEVEKLVEYTQALEKVLTERGEHTNGFISDLFLFNLAHLYSNIETPSEIIWDSLYPTFHKMLLAMRVAQTLAGRPPKKNWEDQCDCDIS